MDKKILTICFSRSGNTKKVAEIIQKAVGGDFAEICTKRNYSTSYAGAILQGGIEKFKNARPEILPLEKNPEGYDILFIGTPVWWFTITPAMKTFLETYDLTGKIVCPFITNGGKPSGTLNDFKSFCKGDTKEGLSVYFKGRTTTVSEEDIAAWALQSIRKC